MGCLPKDSLLPLCRSAPPEPLAEYRQTDASAEALEKLDFQFLFELARLLTEERL